MRFKRSKNGHYTKYCFGCRHYEFERQVGCAYLGKCTAIEDEPTEQDAYDPPCGLWEKRADTPQTDLLVKTPHKSRESHEVDTPQTDCGWGKPTTVSHREDKED